MLQEQQSELYRRVESRRSREEDAEHLRTSLRVEGIAISYHDSRSLTNRINSIPTALVRYKERVIAQFFSKFRR